MDAGGRHPRPGLCQLPDGDLYAPADGELYALLPGEYNKDFFMVGSDYTVYAQEETDEEVSWELRTGRFCGAAGSQVHWENTAVPGAGPGGRGGGGPAPGRRGMGEGTGAERRRSAALHPTHLTPRRCDRMDIRLTGVGHVRLVNWSKYVGYGSEY